MVSLRFPFSFPQRPGRRSPHLPISSSFPFSSAFVAATAAALAGITAGIGISHATSPNHSNAIGYTPHHNPWNSAAPLWASLSLAESSTTAVEPKTGVLFPIVVDGTRRLLGIGLRKKNVFGLKNIDVYAFGVYTEVNDVKKLREKYGVLSESELRGSKEFFADVLDQDLRMTVRLQIVYGRLTIGSVRSAFEESVGNRLKKFSGSENKELLKRFTSLFRDEYKLPRGSVIDLSREQGYILKTRIDGKEVGSIQSKLLCQSILDLYIGEDPFDKKAKEDIERWKVSLSYGMGDVDRSSPSLSSQGRALCNILKRLELLIPKYIEYLLIKRVLIESPPIVKLPTTETSISSQDDMPTDIANF